MKKKLIALITVLIIFILSSVNVCFAGNGASIPVSCTIPVIPGVNAPLIVEERINSQPDKIPEQETETQKETQQKAPTLIQEDSSPLIMTGREKTTVIAQTIYSR